LAPSLKAEAEFRLTGFFVDVPVHRLETIRVIEATTDRVGFENTEFKKRTRIEGAVHEGAADASSLMVGVDEDATHFVAYQRQETDYAPAGLVDHCFGHREPTFGELESLCLKETLGKKGMSQERSPIPDIEQLTEVLVGVRAHNHAANITHSALDTVAHGIPPGSRPSPAGLDAVGLKTAWFRGWSVDARAPRDP
jgi:hypothetical protein